MGASGSDSLSHIMLCHMERSAWLGTELPMTRCTNQKSKSVRTLELLQPIDPVTWPLCMFICSPIHPIPSCCKFLLDISSSLLKSLLSRHVSKTQFDTRILGSCLHKLLFAAVRGHVIVMKFEFWSHTAHCFTFSLVALVPQATLHARFFFLKHVLWNSSVRIASVLGLYYAGPFEGSGKR